MPSIPSAPSLLVMVAGAKGAIASTLAAAVAALQQQPEMVRPYLMTSDQLHAVGPPENTTMVGWDVQQTELPTALSCHGVLPPDVCHRYADAMAAVAVRIGPDARIGLKDQIDRLKGDMADFQAKHPNSRPVLVDLLPAAETGVLTSHGDLDDLLRHAPHPLPPDLAYCLAAVESGIPVVNFTPNAIELPAVVDATVRHRVPIAGRDGKTGQTYFKVVLASALKARQMMVDGWYSLNILGNADGKNLMNPERAAEKLANKTDLLDDILGYRVGSAYDDPSHKVHIDYYPPRGDAKEAWDVIDFKGLFGLPMSIRLNLQGRDSILAAPMVLDLARWAAALKMAGISGPVPELGFYFKKPVGQHPPLTFQAQLESLERLEKMCNMSETGGENR